MLDDIQEIARREWIIVDLNSFCEGPARLNRVLLRRWLDCFDQRAWHATLVHVAEQQPTADLILRLGFAGELWCLNSADSRLSLLELIKLSTLVSFSDELIQQWTLTDSQPRWGWIDLPTLIRFLDFSRGQLSAPAYETYLDFQSRREVSFHP